MRITRDFVPKIVQISKVRLPNPWVKQFIVHPYWYVYCNRRAGAAVIGEWGTLNLPKERIMVIPAWLRWRGQSGPDIPHIWARISLPFDTMLVHASWPRPHLLKNDHELVKQVIQLSDYLQSPSSIAHQLRGQAIYTEIISRWLEQHGEPSSPRLEDAFKTIITYIDAHLHEPLTNEAIAKVAQMSITHLNRRFHDQVQMTPAAWIRQRRIGTAAELLVNSDHRIDHIASTCGFADRNHFTRVFTQTMNMPPATYRKTFRSQER